MNIVFFAPRFHTNQRETVKVLLERGHSVHYYVMFYGFTEDYSLLKPELIPSKETKLVDGSSDNELDYISKYSINIGKTYQLLKGIAPDLVIVRDRSKTMRIVSIICKVLRIPVVLYDQRPLYESKKGILHRVLAKLYNLWVPSTRYTPIVYRASGSDNRKPEKAIKSKKAFYIPFIVTVPEEKKNEYQRDGVLNIIDVGKYRPIKNHTALVEAVERSKFRERIKVTIIGQVQKPDECEYRDNLQKLIDAKGLTSCFKLLSNVDPNEMLQYYYQNDVLALCSLNELASVSVFEAMSCGLSVLATYNNGTSAFIVNNQTGMLFDPQSSKDLSEKIDLYFESDNLAEKMGKSAREYITHNHSKASYVESMNLMLKSISKKLKI